MNQRLFRLSTLLLSLIVVGALPANAGSYGRIQIGDNTEATYRASTGIFTTATSATDIVNFKGSGTKTVYIKKVTWKQGSVASIGAQHVYLIKRSTANSGGTSSALTLVPLDSSFASATASGVSYTANPTTGTSVGTISHLVAERTGYATYGFNLDLFDASKGGSPIVLRGTSESISVNYNGVTDPIGTGAVVDIEWSEK